MTGALLASSGGAQELRGVTMEGYVTAVHSPNSFDVNGEHATTAATTRYKLMGDKMKLTDSPLRAPQVGDYVWVVGGFDKQTGTSRARTLIFWDDLNQKLSGIAVIEAVVSTGAEPVFEADGYRIRISTATETSFHGDLKKLGDVSANTWVRYAGKRDNSGVLLATKAMFAPGKLKVAKDDVVGVAREEMRFQAPDATNKKDGQVNLEMFGGWRTVPADVELQERINRVGMSVVPDYQKTMAESDPLKIKFRFYAVDDERLRSAICSSRTGLILTPRRVVERLKNDDQLAAVLADGVAFTLQRQSTRLIADERIWLGEAAADVAAATMDPWLGLDLVFGEAFAGAHANTKDQVLAEEQRGRIALALMADAGYDPWQAPEAWRLLGPKNLPKDSGALKYPNRSGYQLSILSMQYNGGKAAKGSEAARQPGGPLGGKKHHRL
jgi:hypothetical protein